MDMRVLIHEEDAGATTLRSVDASTTIAEIAGAPELLVFVDERATCEAPELLVLDLVEAGSEITITRNRKVTVDVRFNLQHAREQVVPTRKVRQVLRWALGKDGYAIPADQHANYELVPRGSEQAADLDARVAVYVNSKTATAEFDLRAVSAPQG
jgi:hypothetical protein